MTVDGALLLPAAVTWPLMLAILCLLPRFGSRMILALPLAPIPALAAAFLAPRDAVFALPWLFLDSGLQLDESSRVFVAGSAFLWLAAGVYAARYLMADGRAASFSLFWNVVFAGNIGVYLAADVVSFYVAFALVSLMAYPLVIHDRKEASLRAGAVYIMLAVLGEVALFAAFVLGASAAGGSLMIDDIVAALGQPVADPLVLGLLIIGFGIKAGLMPLHVWLPLAHPAAPVPASAVLSGAIVKAGVFGLAVFLPWGSAWPTIGAVLALLGFGGLFVAALLGVAQHSAKTVLAYSTVSQMGLVMGVAGAALADGVPAGAVVPAIALFALHHGLTKSALFLGVGLAQAWGGATRWLLLLALGALALSLAGLPFTSGALAKAAIKAPAGSAGALLITLSAATSALVLTRFLFTLPSADAGRRPPTLLLLAGGVLAAAALSAPWLFGIPVPSIVPGTVDALRDVLIDAWPLGLGLVLAATGAALGLQAPMLPEGDLLSPLRRLAMRVRAMLGAALVASKSPAVDSNVSLPMAANANLRKIEAMFADHTATAVAVAIIGAALLIALD